MTGRVFTKLLLAFLLVLSLGTAVLDFSVRRIVQRSLLGGAGQLFAREADTLARQAAETPEAVLPAIVRAQASAARADVTVRDREGKVAARAFAAGGDETMPVTVSAGPYTVEYRFSLGVLHGISRLLRQDLLLASLLAFFFATAMAAVLARRAAMRLGRIMRFAHRIAAGDLSARVEEGRLDEISEVAHALDQTAAKLQESFRALESSRGELLVLLHSIPEAVMGVSAAGQVTWSNGIMQALSPAAARAGRSLVECVRDPEVLRTVETAQRERVMGRGRATNIVPGRAFAVSAAPMGQGGAVVMLQDVTDAERSDLVRRDFVANVSHELRPPLTSIRGYVETVLDEPLPEPAREFLNIVLRNANRMNRLTADLLALATVESGDYRLRLRPVRVEVLLQDAVDSLHGMAGDLEMTLEREPVPPDLAVAADEDALHQVFTNLLENAMKYGRGGKRVRVGARAAAGAVEFWVRDWGSGIGSEHIQRIFERFYRVDKARSRESGGTGLGLAIVKHIVQAHGGAVWAESELGQGTTLCFTIPEASRDGKTP